MTFRVYLNIGGLEVAVDDAFFVGGIESFGDLLGERQSLSYRECPAGNPLGEGFPLDKLHNQKRFAFGLFEAV